MNKRISKIENDVQDRNSDAWKKLCAYIDKVATENLDEFSPLEVLGQELFSQIHTLPETISKMTKVKKVWLYRSSLKRIPPEIGQMEALEYFDPYTSYNLHWLPYEITKCKNLKDSRVSTRALYGNWKNRMGFPSLTHNPVRYAGDTVNCSVCGKAMTYGQTNQLWISLRVGTDVLPLLANLCSKECESGLSKPPKGYIQFPHKGGANLQQPPHENQLLETGKFASLENGDGEIVQLDQDDKQVSKPINRKEFSMMKLIRKIWEK